jgi:hypothetical protein
MQVLRTTYVRGRGGQRIRKVIVINFRGNIATPDVYETGTGFKQGNYTGAPAAAQPIKLSDVILEPIRDATVRIIPPTILPYDAFDAALGARFNAVGQIQVDVVSFTPSTTVLIMKCVGAIGPATEGPIVEPATAIGGDIITGTLVIEIEYTPNSGAEA